MAKLNTYVWIGHKRYGPDDGLPAAVAKKITNPDVWAERPNAREDTAGAGGAEQSQEPPRGGPGSGADKWRAFVTDKGITVPEDASARDMQALWDEHKAQG